MSMALWKKASLLGSCLFTLSALSDDRCVQINNIKGASCGELQYEVDSKACKSRISSKTVACDKGSAVIKLKNLNYAFDFYLKSEGGNWVISESKTTRIKDLTETHMSNANKAALAEQAESASLVQNNSEADDSFTIGGYFDAYYSVNSNRPKAINGTTDPYANGGTANPISRGLPQQQTQDRFYDRYTDQIILNLAQVNFTKKHKDVTLYTAFDFGSVAEQNSPGDEIGKHIGLAYLSYNPKAHDRFKFTVGKLPTIIGIELYRSQDNWNYSRTTYYGLGIPFWYTAAEAEYKIIPDKLTAKAVVANSWGPRVNVPSSYYDNNKSKLWGLNFSYTGAKYFLLNYSVLSGGEADAPAYQQIKTIHNVNWLWDVNEDFSLAFDTIYAFQNNRKYAGASLMAKFNINTWWWFSPRYEYFADPHALAGQASPGFVDGINTVNCAGQAGSPCQRQNNITLTNTFILNDGLEFRLEARRDHSSVAYFRRSSDANSLAKTQTNFTAALLYKF